MKKEYTLKIIYDPTNDEIDHLSEALEEDINFVIEVNGKDIPITNEMGEYMLKYVDGVEVTLTSDEVAAKAAKDKAWSDGAYTRQMIIIRSERNVLLRESDWTDLPNSPLTDSKKTEWQTYRTNLRDITKDVTTIDEANSITWPTKPS